MREEEFRRWLAESYVTANGVPLTGRARATQLSVCKKVERSEGDLDDQFRTDGMRRLFDRLSFSREEARAGVPLRHSVPIAGNVYTGTAFLRSCVSRYRQFCRETAGGVVAAEPSAGVAGEASDPGVPEETPTPRRRGPAPMRAVWPEWPGPSDAAHLALAHHVAPLVRFLHPDVVARVVEDNERHRAAWADRLRRAGIDPDLYLWERCATTFPGVRRFVGGREQAQLRGHVAPDPAAPVDALVLDDNSFPKHIWSFALQGRRANRAGPRGYTLAHLADHKRHGSRLAEDFTGGEALGCLGLPGLFTSAANTAYVPAAFVRPTDTSSPLRNLLVRRAEFLYGAVCRLVPQGMAARQAPAPHWDVEGFEWAEPVGSPDWMDAFLEFRRLDLERTFAGVPTR
jgi:hypothetical protein